MSIYMVVLTRKHPTHVAHVAPTLRVGWATWVGCFLLSLSYARTRRKLFFADFSLKEHYFQNFYVSLPLEHWLMVLMEQETVKLYFFL